MTTPDEPGDDDLYTTEPPRFGSGRSLSLAGFGCAVLALLFCPILFGPAGIAFGIFGHQKGEPLGKWAAVASGVALILGTVLGVLYYNTEIRHGMLTVGSYP